uniref:Sterol 3-beta-glucosyltransferase UGT80B1 n=1 Tax=Rhizophora mucronata TaxID=61149 RepID=A0A2P2LDL3_RHIMU
MWEMLSTCVSYQLGWITLIFHWMLYYCLYAWFLFDLHGTKYSLVPLSISFWCLMLQEDKQTLLSEYFTEHQLKLMGLHCPFHFWQITTDASFLCDIYFLVYCHYWSFHESVCWGNWNAHFYFAIHLLITILSFVCFQKKLLVELVKIQNDGTVEVDIAKSAPVASELLELHPVEGSSFHVDDLASEVKKPIPKLKICILVVGTRGDVQPFLAMAKRLQEFGHRVRLATHANFSSFVKSAGVEFYPLGGDPRVLAEYMARNKGLIPSGPGDISMQKKQLKAIIESLLPACTEPDLETSASFRAQAVIANPPAYG